MPWTSVPCRRSPHVQTVGKLATPKKNAGRQVEEPTGPAKEKARLHGVNGLTGRIPSTTEKVRREKVVERKAERKEEKEKEKARKEKEKEKVEKEKERKKIESRTVAQRRKNVLSLSN